MEARNPPDDQIERVLQEVNEGAFVIDIVSQLSRWIAVSLDAQIIYGCSIEEANEIADRAVFGDGS